MQYAQPTVKAEDIRLPGLDGMLPGGDVKGREKTALEYLIEVGNNVMSEGSNASSSDQLHVYYLGLYKRLKNDLLRGLEFSALDIESYVHMNLEDQRPSTDNQQKGIYTGCLLHLLTERNKAKNLPTRVYIDGKGRYFDYLFYHAEQADEVIVNNLKGQGICDHMANNYGRVNLILVANSQGEWIASDVAQFGGEAGAILMINCLDQLAGSRIGDHSGRVDLVLLERYRGWSSLSNCCSNSSQFGMVVLANNYCNDLAGKLCRHESNTGLFFAENNEPANRLGNRISAYGSNMPLAVIASSRGEKLCLGAGVPKGNLGKLVLHDLRQQDLSKFIKAKRIIRGQEAAAEYARIRQHYRVGDIISLSETIRRDTPKEQILRVADSIKRIYKDVKPKIDKLLEKCPKLTKIHKWKPYYKISGCQA